MGWQAYDPKAPPKVGQKARCANFGEMVLPATGTGAPLTRGISFAELVNKDWEIFWEPTKLPPIGSTFEVAPCAYAMVGSIGKIVSHTGYGGAIVEWITKATKEEHPTDWSFPNYNVRVLETPAPDQAKVGDLFREVGTGAVVRINASDGGKCAAEVLFSGNSGYTRGEIRHGFGSTIIDDSWNHWKRVVPPKVGEVYRTHDKHATHQSAIEITEIIDHRVSAKILETTSIWKVGSDHSDFIHLEHGCMPAHWLPVKTPVKEPKVKAEVGRVYRIWDGDIYRITEIVGNSLNGNRLDETGKEDTLRSFKTPLDALGFPLNEHGCIVQLVPDYCPEKCAVGQIYRKRDSGQVVKITKIRYGKDCDVEVLETGNGKSPGKKGELRAPFAALDDKDGASKWTSAWDYLPNYSPPKQIAVVGQVFRRISDGWTFKVIEPKNAGIVSVETVEGSRVYKVGDRDYNAWSEDHFLEVMNSYFQLVENYQTKILVGQVWRRKTDGWVFKITVVKDGYVAYQTLERGGTGYEVGYVENKGWSEFAFLKDVVESDSYKAVENYQPKMFVGQVWRRPCGWTFKITKVDDGISKLIRATVLEVGDTSFQVGGEAVFSEKTFWSTYVGKENCQVVENYQPKVQKVQVGQVYSNNGWVVRIVGVKGEGCSAETLEPGNSGWKVGHVHSFWGGLKKDGTLVAAYWKLVENHTPQPKFQVGQVWKNPLSGNWTVQITKIRSDGIAEGTTLEQGTSGFKVGYQHKSLIGEEETQGWELIENYVPAVDLLSKKVEVGQVWKSNSGWTVRIVRIKGVWTEGETLARPDAPSEIGKISTWKAIDSSGQFEIPGDWVQQENYVVKKEDSAVKTKIKVGQVWTYHNGFQVQVHRIDGIHVSIRVLKRGGSDYKVGETDTNYETLDKDGYAGYHLSGKNWSLTQEAAHMPAKVGEVYDMGGWKVKITKIALGGMVSAKTLEGTGLTYRPGTIHDNLCYADSNGRMPPYWELMEMTDQSPPEKPMHKVRVGQVWTFATGCVVKITKIGDKHASAHVVQRGASIWRDGEDVDVFAVIYGDGAIDPGGSWALTTEAPITLEERSLPKVGQVYRRNNDVVKITKVPPTPGRVDVDMVKGDSGWKYLSTYGNGKMNIDWELIEEPIENKSSVQVGQLWKRPDGWTVKITEVNGIGVKSECVESGTSVHKPGTTYTWATWLVDKNAPPKGWERVDNVEQTMKVGQVWAESAPRNCKVQIVGIENGYAQVVMLRSGTSGYPEGHRHNSWFLLRSKYDTWKLEMDAPEYGDRVEVEIGGKKISGTYLGDVGGERNVVHLDEKYDSGSSASWSAGADKKLEGLKLKVGRFCWSVVEGLSKITKVVKKENGNMSNEKKDTQDKESFGSMFKADMTDAAWRAGATGMTTAVKTAILAMLKDKGADDGRLSMAKELMESEFGSIMVRALIGYGLTYAPMVSEDPRAQKLAKEFRVSAMNGGMDQVMGIGFEYLLPAVQGALKALPPISEAVPEMLRSKPKHRVAPADDAADEDEEEMEEEKTSAANAG